MAGGMKEVVINNQERAVSVDINRLQKFKGADIAELMRFWGNVGVGSDDLDAAAVTVETTTVGNPLLAEIVNGFLVRPQAASLNLLVDRGVLYAIAPDGAADDSVYKYVRDAGVSTPGALAVTNNIGGGAIRIDVVEVQVVTNANVETDSRDIFNSVTGLFSATTVSKASADGLNYRVRMGSPGGGFPGTVSGWLPLAVISMPDGATSVDTMTFWDVRPLINDRQFQPSNLGTARPVINKALINASALATVGGWVEAFANGRRLGGCLRSGGIVTDADTIDLTDAANHSSTFAAVANHPWYLYLVTPFGLPRWARYNAAGSRVPRSPRGIPVATTVAPNADGLPSGAIPLPTASGLGSNTSAGLCIAAGYFDNSSAQIGFFGNNADGFHNVHSTSATDPIQVAAGTANVTGGDVNGNGYASWTLTPGTHFPAHARSLFLEFRTDLTTNTGAGSLAEPRTFTRVYSGSTRLTDIATPGPAWYIPSGTPTLSKISHALWLPVPAVYPSSTAANFRVDVEWDGNALFFGAIANTFVRVLGWKF